MSFFTFVYGYTLLLYHLSLFPPLFQLKALTHHSFWFHLMNISSSFQVNNGGENTLHLEQLKESLRDGHHGVLVLLPVKSVDGDGFTLSSMKMINPPVEDIQKLAEVRYKSNSQCEICMEGNQTIFRV